jgi:hypothetical protein
LGPIQRNNEHIANYNDLLIPTKQNLKPVSDFRNVFQQKQNYSYILLIFEQDTLINRESIAVSRISNSHNMVLRTLDKTISPYICLRVKIKSFDFCIQY